MSISDTACSKKFLSAGSIIICKNDDLKTTNQSKHIQRLQCVIYDCITYLCIALQNMIRVENNAKEMGANRFWLETIIESNIKLYNRTERN